MRRAWSLPTAMARPTVSARRLAAPRKKRVRRPGPTTGSSGARRGGGTGGAWAPSVPGGASVAVDIPGGGRVRLAVLVRMRQHAVSGAVEGEVPPRGAPRCEVDHRARLAADFVP